MTTLLNASAVEATRGGRRLFSNLSFTLHAGEALLLTGPNGSGKSSLLRLLAGFGRPTRGGFLWDGMPIAADLEAHQRRLHWIGFHDGIKPALSVRETLDFWITLAETPAEKRTLLKTSLQAVGLSTLIDTPCRLLSSGQRKRLSLARLLTAWRTLWLLDEPSVGLDADGIATLSALITDHLESGGMAIIATHQPLALPHAQGLALSDFPPAFFPPTFDTASGDTASGDTASGDTASGDTASGDTASDENWLEDFT